MARPRTPIGTFGEIEFTPLTTGGVRARVRFRDHDGQLRRIESTAPTRKLAEHGWAQPRLQHRPRPRPRRRPLPLPGTSGRVQPSKRATRDGQTHLIECEHDSFDRTFVAARVGVKTGLVLAIAQAPDTGTAVVLRQQAACVLRGHSCHRRGCSRPFVSCAALVRPPTATAVSIRVTPAAVSTTCEGWK